MRGCVSVCSQFAGGVLECFSHVQCNSKTLKHRSIAIEFVRESGARGRPTRPIINTGRAARSNSGVLRPARALQMREIPPDDVKHSRPLTVHKCEEFAPRVPSRAHSSGSYWRKISILFRMSSVSLDSRSGCASEEGALSHKAPRPLADTRSQSPHKALSAL